MKISSYSLYLFIRKIVIIYIISSFKVFRRRLHLKHAAQSWHLGKPQCSHCPDHWVVLAATPTFFTSGRASDSSDATDYCRGGCITLSDWKSLTPRRSRLASEISAQGRSWLRVQVFSGSLQGFASWWPIFHTGERMPLLAFFPFDTSAIHVHSSHWCAWLASDYMLWQLHGNEWALHFFP